jgi:uncharacterized protein
MQQLSRTVPAPAHLGAGLATVPAGSDMELDLRLESVVEGVLVSGTADFDVLAECARCLDPVTWQDSVELQELYAYPPTDARGAVVQPAESDEDDPVPLLSRDLLDLEPTLRDAVVLVLPLAPVCSEECLGLCVECGARLADDPGHAHAAQDPRWAALAALAEGQQPPADPDGSGGGTVTAPDPTGEPAGPDRTKEG